MTAVSPALVESRAEYAVGSLILVVRWLIRIKTLGVRGWYWDDWFSVSVFVWHTALFAMVEYLAVVGAPLGFTQEQREALSPEMAVQLRNGAQAMYASFFILINFVWSAKAVLIVFFMRLTRQTNMIVYMYVVVGISVACWVAACIATFTHCLPIERNWQILPDPGFECSAGVTQNIVIATGNVVADALLLVVPVRTLWDVQMSLLRKIGITFLLSLGLFVMAMAIARCILSVDNGPGVAQSSVWVFREALVTIFAINAPIMTALFRRETWTTRRSGTAGSGYPSRGTGSKSGAIALQNTPTIGGSGVQNNPRKIGEIYKTTEFETSSRESTSNLVAEGSSKVIPQNLR
ncbi:unnamed protein product [Clonostachys rosea]|uniref:Rhodopsin domain-containing protein n=1 Tax=Bionectria ochroleuca TaxID=29856 RepID=A0ABY6UIN1_BIOOC|nr:unnamed protein product [Clonostachys rosea]